MPKASLAAFAAIAVFCSLPFAVPLEKFLNTSFEPGQSVGAKALAAPGSLLLIVADGTETYVFDSDAGAAVADKQKLQGLLVADSKSSSGFESKVSSALALESEVKNAKNKSEAECMRLTGMEMHECTDKDTCVLACMSNPNCVNVLYGDGFWEAMLDWANAKKKFDSSLSSYAQGIEAVKSDSAAIDSKSAVLDNLLSTASNISANPVFLDRNDPGCSGSNATLRCFEYCHKINYSSDRLAAEKQNLASLKAALGAVQQQPARAEAILASGAKNDLYLSTRGKDFAELRLKAQNDVKRLNASYEAMSKKVKDAEIPPMIDALSALSAKILADGEAGSYRKALSQKDAFLQESDEINDRMSSDLAKLESVTSEISSLQDKVDKGAWLLGNQTAGSYRAQLGAIKANITSSAVTLSQISSARADLDALKLRIVDELSSKATSGAGVAQGAGIPAKLPCLPGLALLSVLLFAGVRKG